METVKIKLRKAAAWDLKVDAKTLRYGQPFWVRSKTSGQFDNKAQIINEDTDAQELAAWLKQEMLYVPASDSPLTPEGGNEKETVGSVQ